MLFFFFSSRRRHTRSLRDWSSDVCSSDLQTVAFALHHARRWEPPPLLWDQAEIVERLDDAIAGWRSWSRLHQAYEGPWKDLVHHSGRVLQALTFQPTDAIVAAPTTSLP